jgi:hypothetical protein
MNDFDELLDQILHEDRHAEHPPDMKKRIVAAVSIERRHFRRGQIIWIGVAASVLVGVTSWMLVRIVFGGSIAIDRKQASITKQVPISKLDETWESRSLQPTPAQVISRKKVDSRAAIRREPPLQQSAIRIAPMKIRSLVIQPIEIASLSFSDLTRKGKIR